MLEKRNKKLQLDNFLLDHKLFLIFDADIVKDEIQQEYWGEFLVKYKDKIVIEITENGSDDEISSENEFDTEIPKASIRLLYFSYLLLFILIAAVDFQGNVLICCG